MKQLFQIKDAEQNNSRRDILLIEAGDDYCCYATGDKAARAFYQMDYYTFDVFTAAESIQTIVDAIEEKEQFAEVIIHTAFPQAVIIPLHLYKEETGSELLRAMYPVYDHQVLQDRISEWQTIVVHAIPQPIYQVFIVRFPAARLIHTYTSTLKNNAASGSRNEIAVHFTNTALRVQVKRNRQLLLMQTFGYTVPLDAIYVLLKILTELGLQQEETTILLSGFIHNSSALYKELHHYFLHLQMATRTPSFSFPHTEHPPHFFTSLHNIAACAL